MGTWSLSGLPLHRSNAVYASRDRRNRVNRRVSKEDNMGNIITGGNYDALRTACRHENITYIARFRNKTKEEVDAMIGTTLQAVVLQSQALVPAPAWVGSLAAADDSSDDE